MKKKIILSILVLTLLFGGTLYPSRANAIFGLADITINPESVVGWIWEVAKEGFNIAKDIAFESLKKRILDQIVDQTIQWIQGGGKPKFVTDFGGLLEDSAQAAVGDVAQEIKQGQLCTGIPPARIIFQLETPVFSQRVSCTLDDIVGNIEQFADSFQDGGFIGYQELLKPHNNQWGVEILTLSEVERRQSQRQNALQQEVSTGKGFLSTKECLEWEARGTDHKGKAVSQKFPADYWSPTIYDDPSEPPVDISVTAIPNDLEWVCSKESVTTPGTAIAAGLEKNLYSDLDYLLSAKELTAYIGAIFDAAINRLITEGVKGVRNLKPSGSSAPTDCDDSRLSAEARSACRDYLNQVSNIQELNEQTQSEQKANQATTNIITTQGSIESLIELNNNLATTTQALVDCETGRGASCTQNPALSVISTNSGTLSGYFNELEQIGERVEQLKNVLRSAPSILRNVLQTELDNLINRVGEIRALVESIRQQVTADSARVGDQLDQCEDQSNTSYSCPSP